MILIFSLFIQEITTIKKALEYWSGSVTSAKLEAARNAYDLLSMYADDLFKRKQFEVQECKKKLLTQYLHSHGIRLQ